MKPGIAVDTTLKMGIAIDTWKLAIFERHLKAAGYAFTVTQGKSFTAIRVDTTNAHALAIVVKAANDEAQRTGAPK